MDQSVPPGRVRGICIPPCSKSYAQRALAASLLAEGTSRLHNIEFCDDTRSAIRCIEALGARVRRTGERTLEIDGGLSPAGDKLYVGQSGLSTRLFTPIASLCDTPIGVVGEGPLLHRSFRTMIRTLRALGVRVHDRNDHLPLHIQGPIRGGEVQVEGLVSSQFITGLLLALPLAGWAARRAGFETLNRSLSSYFAQHGAAAFLALIILYKLGDAFAGSLTTPFLIKGMGFAQEEVGIANKVIGIWLTIFGAFVGGLIMTRLALYRSLLLFGVLQLVSNFGFYLLAQLGKGAWGAVMLPAFDWGFVSLDAPAALDLLLLTVIAGENITGGMGTVAFVALLMGLCNQRFTATHYAMLSAFAAVGRIYVSPLSGVLSQSIGWPAFFIFSIVVAVPGVVMVWWLRDALARLGRPQTDGMVDD